VQYLEEYGKQFKGLDDQQPTRVKLLVALSGSTHGKVWVLRGLRYMLLPPEMVIVSRETTVSRVAIGLVQEEMSASYSLVSRNWLVAAKRP
jgi:hypothetical protein